MYIDTHKSRLYNLFELFPEKMSVLEAYRHIKEDKPYINCASAVVHALSQQTPHELSTLAVLDNNAQSLVDIAACVAVEHARKGNFTATHAMEPEMTPSYFFRNVQRQISHHNDGGYYIGGLMATVERTLKGPELHVIGVMNHHKGRQEMFTVCDTSKMFSKTLVRRMTPREMDERIIDPGVYEDYRALALVGYPLEVLEQDPDLHGDLSSIEHEMQMAEYRMYECLERVGLFHMVQTPFSGR